MLNDYEKQCSTLKPNEIGESHKINYFLAILSYLYDIKSTEVIFEVNRNTLAKAPGNLGEMNKVCNTIASQWYLLYEEP